MSLPVRTFPVIVKDHAFATGRFVFVPVGSTCEAIVAAAGLTPVQRAVMDVTVNGALINREYWHLIRPKRCDAQGNPHVIMLVPIPRGGRSSRKILSNAIILAAVVAGAIVSGGTLLPALGPLTIAQTNAAAGALLVAAGALAGRLIAPPPIKPKEREQREVATAGIAGNPLKPNDYLPCYFGFVRASPAIISPPYTVSENERQKVLACFGAAGRYSTSEILLNGMDIDEFDDATYQVKEGTSSDTAMTHEAALRTGIQQAGSELTNFVLEPDGGTTNVPLKNNDVGDEPQWQYFTTSGTCTQFWIDLFIAGLLKTNDGAIAAIAVRVEFRRKGTSTWLKAPVAHIKNDKEGGDFRQYLRFMFETSPGGIDANDTNLNTFAVFRKTAPGETFEYTAHAYFTDDGAGENISSHVDTNEDGAIFYLDPATFTPGAYEVRVKRSLAFQYSELVYTAGVYEWNTSTALANFFEAFDDGGTLKARIGQTKYQSSAVIERFVTIDDDNPPFDLPAPLQVWKLALDVTNKQIDSVSVLFKSKVPIWNGSNWNTVAESNNPAALCRALLVGTNDLNDRPPGASKLETDAFEDWYEYCEDHSPALECNLVWEGGGSVEALLATIAACGAARLVRRPKWAPVIEKDRSAEDPVQSFTGLNTRGIAVNKAFLDLPHGWRVEYLDENDDFREKTVTVYAPGYDAGTATRIDAQRFEGPTNATLVQYLATLALRQLYYRQATYSVTVFLEHLMSRPGDLVALNHDVIFSGHIPARLAFAGTGNRGVINDVGTILSLKLEEPIDIAAIIDQSNSLDDIPIASPVTAVGVGIRLKDGTVITGEVTQGVDAYTLDFVTPFTDPGPDQLNADCIVGLGPLGNEYRRGIITDMQPGDGGTCNLTLVDEAPEIHA